MPFTPDTDIYLFKGTRVSSNDQPYFSSEGAKIAWYMSHETRQFTAQSYQRENRRYARVNAPAASLRGYDMMAFRNAAADRWIICNITGTEFINPNTTDVFFETDSMQTWIDAIEWCDCWVEREMVDDDWNGALPGWKSTIVEGINPGNPYTEVLYDATPEVTDGGWTCHVLSAYDKNAEENYNTIRIGDYITGVNDITVNLDGELDLLLKAYADKGRLDGIVGIWVYPTKFSYYSPSSEFFSFLLPQTIAGYKPKNSKCFCSEFCKVELVNRMGDAVEYAPEYLGALPSGNIQFAIQGVFAAGAGGIRCSPVKYMGVEWDTKTTPTADYGVVLPADIQCAYTGNTFANWLSQNRIGVAAQLIGAGVSVAGGVVGAASAAGAGAGALSVAQGVASAAATISSITSRLANPAGVYGQTSSLGLFPATKTFGFRVNFKSPGYDVIKSIDDFFSVYGYKVCKMKKPNVNTRPFWNYVKCSPAIVGGPMNSADRANIENMMNAGVTFWNVQGGATIGDYSPDNRG